jgi:transposase
MFGRETRMLLRHYLEQGTSKSALARQLGVSRDTIHRWIREGDLDRDFDDEAVHYGPRPSAPTKLDPYKPIIEARLAAYPDCRPYACSTRSAPLAIQGATAS